MTSGAAMEVTSRNVCAFVAFVGWLIALLSPSCDSEGNGTIPTEENSSDPTEMMMNETRNVSSEILPRLYGVIAASALITVVVCTLICTIIILVHCFKMGSGESKTYTLRQLAQEPDEDKDIKPPSPEIRGQGSTTPEGGYLLLKQTTV